MGRISKDRISNLLDQVNSGKTVASVLSENPDIKKSTFYYHIKKSKNSDTNLELDTPKPKTKPSVKFREPEALEATKALEALEAESMPIQDEFLNGQMQEMGYPEPSKYSSGRNIEDILGGFSLPAEPRGQRVKHIDDNILSRFQPDYLSHNPPKLEENKLAKGSTVAGHGKSWWTKIVPEKKVKTPEQIRTESQMVKVQKIRLYLVHFPFLEDLHIVPKLKDGKANVDKWLISLYTKKDEDLEKILDFLQFHVRNNLNENGSLKVAEGVLGTGTKVVEHILMACGVKCQGLSKNIMEDPDINRCIKEIMIDNSISLVDFSPKVDLTLKMLMKIINVDASNRIKERIEAQAEAKAKQMESAGNTVKPVSQSLLQKYDDL